MSTSYHSIKNYIQIMRTSSCQVLYQIWWQNVKQKTMYPFLTCCWNKFINKQSSLISDKHKNCHTVTQLRTIEYCTTCQHCSLITLSRFYLIMPISYVIATYICIWGIISLSFRWESGEICELVIRFTIKNKKIFNNLRNLMLV